MNMIPPDELSALLDSVMQRKLSTIAALVILLYEHCITLKDEVKYIWGRKFNPVLGTYILSKYLGMIAQSINVYKVVWPMATPGGPSQKDCMSWFASGIAAGIILLVALDFILMLRIYALYRKTTSITVFLSILFVGMLISDVVCGWKSIYEVSYNPVCDPKRVHPTVVHFGIALWTVHAILLILTGLKYNLVVMGIPIAKLVARDGVWVVGGICLLFAFTIPYMTLRAARADLAFIWPTTFFSIASFIFMSTIPAHMQCCRVIMNMQTLDIGQPDQERGLCSASSTCAIELVQLGLEV
ncbi:hypothetical protein CPC08DRAFT_797151 [Agrocybe pediades]|nr:hypothetical protein CPC08DRAFT_797151 [Agrocybe pediades]